MWKYCAVLFFYYIECADLKYFVHTEVGKIQGLQAEDGDYTMFLGIPYAQVNLSNPFGASIPYPRFDGVFSAFDDSAICPQIEEISEQFAGTLDCLRLNIYVPNIQHKKNLPIFFYIHGGNYNQGYSGRYFYGPKYLVRHNIIVVTINYRLGPYGFLCTDTPEIPGNQGLKDQYTALEWVRKNIEAFGGNRRRITAAGQSAGSMSVDFHILSKQPRLFSQAILQSGSALYVRSILPSEKTATIRIAEKLEFKTKDQSTALSFLAKTKPALVINATISQSFRICVEKEIDGVFRLISEHPEVAISDNVGNINILAGFTNDEWLFGIYGNTFKSRFNDPNIIQEDLNIVFDFKYDEEIRSIIERFYLGDKKVGEATKYNVIDFLSDFEMTYPVQRILERYQKYKNTNIYQYLFSYVGDRNYLTKRFNITERRATHADELAYLFDSKLNREEPNIEDEIMINRMTTLWANFVKYGNPTPRNSDLIPTIWPKFTENSQSFLNIDRNLSIKSRPFNFRYAFWDLVYKAYGDKLKAKAYTETLITNNGICDHQIINKSYLFCLYFIIKYWI